MKSKLIMVADLGLLRGYRVVQGINDHQPRLELVDEWRPQNAHEKLSDQVTDKAGRFPRGSGAGNVPGDLSAGEHHNLELEQRRRQIKFLADRIASLLDNQNIAGGMLAAAVTIHDQLLDALAAPARAKIDKTLALDLTKADPSELLARFAPRMEK